MGRIVTAPANPDFTHHMLRMGTTVAVLAADRRLVRFLMAACAFNVAVFAPARFKELRSRLVTYGAVLRRHVKRIGDFSRCMGLVASIAVLFRHLFRMRLMAFNALHVRVFNFGRVADVAAAAAHLIVPAPFCDHFGGR
jgi:hypothetical protein